MQSLLGLSPVRVAPPSPISRGYSVCLLAPEPSLKRWPSFVTSVVLHVAVVLMLPAIAASVTPSAEEMAVSRNERLMRTLRIRIPEPLYLAASGPAVERRKPFAVFKTKPPKPAGASRPASATGAKPAARREFRRRLELPAVPKRIITDQILIQPRSPAEMLPSAGLQLPELFFWAPPPPRQPVRPFVRPGHRSPPQARMRLDAPPRIETPEPNPMRVAAAPGTGAAGSSPAPLVLPGQGVQQARMRLDAPPRVETPGFSAARLAASPVAGAGNYAPAPSMPVRTSMSQNPQPAAPVADTVPGDPANVLALSARSLPVREFVTVPPGNQVSETPRGAAGTALSGPPGNGGGGSRGGAGTGSAAFPSAPGAESARSADSGMPESPGPVNAQPAARGEAQVAAPYRLTDAAGSTQAASIKAAIEATRMVHPSNGVFDVVVQSSGPEGFPESAGVLSSKPVYSVYLRVGAKRDWILQYCVPAADAPALEVSGQVVRLGAPARLNAPFPITTFRPPARQGPGRYLMLHGFITAEGRFEGLRPLGVHDAADLAATSAALEGWTFRPATREGRPLRVEILLAIPAE